jgi:hypothetical protein
MGPGRAAGAVTRTTARLRWTPSIGQSGGLVKLIPGSSSCRQWCIRRRRFISLVRRPAGQRRMRAPCVVEFNPGIQAGAQFGSRFEGIQINALVFQRSPQSFNEHIVQPTTASIHRYANFLRQQQAGELRAGELTSLDALLFVKRFRSDLWCGQDAIGQTGEWAWFISRRRRVMRVNTSRAM